MALGNSYEYKLRTTPSHLLSSQERKDQKRLLEQDKLREEKNRLESKDKGRTPNRTYKYGGSTRIGGMGLPPGFAGGIGLGDQPK